jgi:hypothetical protein
LPGGFEADHGLIDVPCGKMQPIGQLACRRWADAFHPAEHDRIDLLLISAGEYLFNNLPVLSGNPPSY